MEKKLRDLDYDKTRKSLQGDPTQYEDVKHRDFLLKIFEAGKRVGTVRVLHYTKPFSFFYFKWIETEASMKYQSTDETSGIGGTIIRNINHFLKNRKGGQIGVLQDSVASHPQNSKIVYDIYEDHGWEDLGNNTQLIFEGRKLTDEERAILLDLF